MSFGWGAHFLWVASVLAAVFSAAFAHAAPDSATRDLRYTHWQTENGLPSNKINDVLQTKDGFIWIATYDGLARFDGEKFTLFDENNSVGLTDHSLTCLFEDDAGVLWIGHSGGAVTRLKEGRFETTRSHHSPPQGITKSIAADEAGDMWSYGDSGLLTRLKDGLVLKPEAGAAHLLVAMTRSPTGKIWVANEGLLSALEGSRLVRIPLEPEGGFIQGICATRDGGLWIASGDRIRKFKDGRWCETLGPLPVPSMAIHVFKETANGQLVAGSSDHGLYLISTEEGGAHRQLSRANGFASDWVLSVCEDREGGLWVGTGGAGLLMIRRSQVDTPAPPDGWQNRAVLSVTPARAGGLWIGTEGAGLYRLNQGQWENFALKAGIRNPYVWSVLEDSQGVLWAGTWSNGVYRKIDDAFVRPPGLQMNIPMPAIYEAASGGLWVGTEQGLMRYRSGVGTWAEPVPEKRLRDIRAVKETADGTVWFGSNGGGLGRLKNGETRHFGKADGLPSEFIQCLHLDRSGALWIGTSGAGIVRFKAGAFFTVGLAQGLPNAVICHIEEDENGYVWLSSHGGILRVSKAELDRCVEGQVPSIEVLSYGLSDGMPSLDCSGGMQPAGCKLPDGRLAFGTSKGLAIIDPARLELNPIVPPVAIVSFKVDGHDTVAPLANARAPLIIAAGPHRLEFQYAGLSFAAPEKVRFKRRLTGLETEWVSAGGKRSADYNYIPPGEYIFQVTACNNDGIWNTTGASLAFTVLPFFWQTLWFKFLTVALLIAASSSVVWFETHRRLRQKLALVEQKRAVALERARIASDMHDDLGSQLTQITMLSETARSGLDTTAVASNHLTQIYDTARGLTRAMDEIVWAVNPRHDTMESLVTYLEKFALDFLGAAGIRCRLELPLEYPVWTPSSELRHNLFLAFKEALNNAIKHAGATVVLISLEISPSDYQLVVQDDGRGFSPTAPDKIIESQDRLASGNGLENMRRRMARINGRCEIVSTLGQGTKVTFLVPATPPLGK